MACAFLVIGLETVDGLVLSIGAADIPGVTSVITSSEDAFGTEAEHPTTVRTVAIDIVVNFFIGDLTFHFFSTGVVIVGFSLCNLKRVHLYILRGKNDG